MFEKGMTFRCRAKILSSSLSFLIDRFTYGTGLLRSTLTLGAPRGPL